MFIFLTLPRLVISCDSVALLWSEISLKKNNWSDLNPIFFKNVLYTSNYENNMIPEFSFKRSYFQVFTDNQTHWIIESSMQLAYIPMDYA